MRTIEIPSYIPSAFIILCACYFAIATLMALVGLDLGAFLIGCIMTILTLGLAKKFWPN